MAKLAVIQTGGKQYLVEEGVVIDIEKLQGQDGKIEFDEVLMIDDGKTVKLGAPVIEKAKVTGEIIEQFKDDKVSVIKMHRRKRYRRNVGHRQNLTKVKITKISA
ncbi:MAG: 50S ribosomal protein L21 [Patescibacteria group bacterium]|nr:50S ribosomal protein L21 [Patescibacteria group bacterium]